MTDPRNVEIRTFTESQLVDALAKGELRRAIILNGSDIVERTIRTIVALGYATEAELRAEIKRLAEAEGAL